MKKLLTIIPAAAGESISTIECEAKGLLARLQSLVGGYVEIVPAFSKYNERRALAYANEDGIARGLPLNARATVLWMEQLIGQVLVGEPRLFGVVVIEQTVPKGTAKEKA